MGCAGVMGYLEIDMLSLNGSTEQQKQPLFDSFLQKLKTRVIALLVPDEPSDNTKFRAAVKYVIGTLIAD